MKDVYMAPEALPVLFSSEVIVCTSPTGIDGERQGYGDAIEDIW